MKEIDHPALIQEWKLNPDTEKYLNKIDKKEILIRSGTCPKLYAWDMWPKFLAIVIINFFFFDRNISFLSILFRYFSVSGLSFHS